MTSSEQCCCVVGGGPAGVVLAFLLARQGVPRHAAGSPPRLRPRLPRRHHPPLHPRGARPARPGRPPARSCRTASVQTLELRHPDDGPAPCVDFEPCSIALPVRRHDAAGRSSSTSSPRRRSSFPTFRLVLGANVQRLVEEDGVVRGRPLPRPTTAWHEVRAAADGRRRRPLLQGAPAWPGSSRCRAARRRWTCSGSACRAPGDPRGSAPVLHATAGRFAVLDRGDEWQIGYVIPRAASRTARPGIGRCGRRWRSWCRGWPTGSGTCRLAPGWRCCRSSRAGCRAGTAGPAADRRRGPRHVAGGRRGHQLRHPGRGRGGQPAAGR